MSLNRLFSFSFIALIMFSCSSEERLFENLPFQFNRDLQSQSHIKILKFKDHRYSDSLLQFVNSEDPNVLFELALAASSIQDSTLSVKLAERVKDISYPELRKVIYYAIGQSSGPEISVKLFEFLKLENHESAKTYLMEAIGKSGNSESLFKLMSYKGLENEMGMARALYNFSLKNILSKESVQLAVRFLDSDNVEVRLLSSNLLARLKGEQLLEYAEVLLRKLEEDTEAGVRMNIATTFNKVNSNAFAHALLERINDPKEVFGVKVNSINSCNYFHYETVSPTVFNQIKNEELKIALEAVSFYENRCEREDWIRLANMRDSVKNKQLRAKILGVLLKHAKKDEKQAIQSHIRKSIIENSDPFIKAFYLSSMRHWLGNYESLSNWIFSGNNIVVNSQAMQSFYELSKSDFIIELKDKDEYNELIAYFSKVFERAILSGEPTLIGYGAKGLRNKDINYLTGIKDIGFINIAINNLNLPRDVETQIDLQKTIDFAEGREIKHIKPPLNHFIDIEQLREFQKYKYCQILTNKGDFEVKLDHINSPASVANYIELSLSGFYDSLRFHRVENNFVVQGGCPRGDGWGSSGESIRSEFGPHYFKKGSLGMASAGKDTESCQWFVTHYQSSHLDGFYTNFAITTEGFDVVNELCVGDTIFTIIPK